MASSYYDSAGKDVVDGDVAYAADLNDINAATDTGFKLVEAAVGTIAANQSYYADLAEKWAENPEDTAVTPGKYSALHWAAKAEDDATQTAADRVQTGLDRTQTGLDRVQTGADKIATAADRVQTGLDKVATAADRVQTGLDVTAASGFADDASGFADDAEASAILAASYVPTPVSGDEGKVMTVADPFSDGYVLEDIIVPSGRKNYLINGNFDIWQRATSQTSSGYGSDDRWNNLNSGSTKTHSRQSFTLGQTDVPGNPAYYSRTVVTSVAGSGNICQKQHRIEDVTKLSGKTVTVSFYSKADSVKNITIELTQFFGTGGSPSANVNILGQKIALSTSWSKKTLTISVPSIAGKTLGTDNNSSSILVFWFDAGSDYNSRTDTLGQQSGTFDIAQVQLEEGDTATEFEKRTVGDELLLCQRYCCVFDNLGSNLYGGSGTFYGTEFNTPVTMRANPAITVKTAASYSGCTFQGYYTTPTTFAIKVTLASLTVYNVGGGSFILDAEL